MSDTYTEPIYHHDEVEGWHHHHIGAGVIVHMTEAVGLAVDTDGTEITYSKHLADHEDAAAGYDEPCAEQRCEFASLVPDFDEWIVFEEDQ